MVPSPFVLPIRVQFGERNSLIPALSYIPVDEHGGGSVVAHGETDGKATTPTHDIQQDDVLYIFGSPKNIAGLNKYLKM
jgi:hypothetical protein